MKKPRWISFCGWVSVALTAFWVTDWLIAWSSNGPPIVPRVFMTLAVLFSVPMFTLWCLGSMVAAFTRYGAKLRAAEMMRAAGGPGGLFKFAGEDTRATATSPLIAPEGCDVCGQPSAVLRCVEHNVLICESCLRTHHKPERCHYQSITVAPQVPRDHGVKGPRRATSPIDLTGTSR